MRQRLFAAAAVIAVIAGIAFVCSRQSSGQQTTPEVQRSQINVVRVKPYMIDGWIDFQVKRTIPALKKAGVPQCDAYQAVYRPLGEARTTWTRAQADRVGWNREEVCREPKACVVDADGRVRARRHAQGERTARARG